MSAPLVAYIDDLFSAPLVADIEYLTRSAHVLLNLLTSWGKEIKCEAC